MGFSEGALESASSSRFGRGRGAWLVVLFVVLYWAAGNLAFYEFYGHRFNQEEGIFSTLAGFGRLAKALVLDGTYGSGNAHAHRMPFIPYFLALAGLGSTNVLFAALVKNAAGCLLMSAAWVALLQNLSLSRLVLGGFTAAAFASPIVFRPAFRLSNEEAYLIPILLFLFVELLLQRRPSNGRTWFLAVLNASLYLIKSSLLPTSLAFCLLFSWRSRSRRVALAFGAVLGLALVAWGVHCLVYTGRFAIGSSLDAMNGYKGNNEYAFDRYPTFHLDTLQYEGLLDPEVEIHGEWERAAYYRQKLAEFVESEPQKVAILAARKAGVMFLGVRHVPYEPELEGIKRTAARIGAVFMLAFRVAMWALLLSTVVLFFLRRGRTDHLQAVLWCYVVLVLCYSAPYVAGFAYERHVSPLILPTWATALWALDARTKHNRAGEDRAMG